MGFEAQEFDNAKDAYSAYQGYVVENALADFPRPPDAVQVSFGALWIGQTVTLDAYGETYHTPLDIFPRQPFASNYGRHWVPGL